jgi:glycosyltransferase involved in cell wall biosynthesis
MTQGDAPAASLKSAVRRRLGYCRMLEWRNKLTMSAFVPGILAFERAEVARLRETLNPAAEPAEVACVVPTYRRSDKVVEAVESILAQSHPDLTVMVVDDGGGLPRLPADPRVVGVSLARNIGIAGVVRNVGIHLTRSKYVAFLDDDNTWKPHHLATCLEGLKRGPDLVYTAVARRTPSGRQFDVLSIPFDRHRLAEESFVDTSAIVVRRTPDVRFSRLPRNRNTLPGEDWEFVYRLSRNLEVEHLPTVTVDYLLNPGSFYTPWTEDATK